ncbi:type III-A CRISPR-associated RAMP protein Csm3, partial [Thermosulfurimonas dismutans]|uniref:type III-A CRISPR-associated RAMP protein Csm3 n=1 Tax=Thermosulfurimonas dismutans TaxID=999894 RepID=UPI0008380A9A
MERPVLGKITIEGIIHCETGLHIGASREHLEIGAIDSPVVRDPLTREPYIPGSSLKGKLRSLLEKIYTFCEVNGQTYSIFPNRSGGSGTKRHECDDWEPDDSKNFPGSKYCPICRLFGATKNKKGGRNWPARLIVRDAFMTDESREKLENIETGLLYAEWKWENSLDRVTASANPRQLERVPRGTEFKMELVYTVENEEEMKDDLQNLRKALELLEMDYLG